jgi:hypothetical protein
MESKPGRRLTGKAAPERGARDAVGEATVAEKNRQRAARLRIIEAFSRLGMLCDEWPDFVREYYADPGQRTQYHHITYPSPFQPPAFDRLNQSPEDWAKEADRAWELHRKKFLEQCTYWVKAGGDEEIEQVKPTRGTGSRKSTQVERPIRGANTSIQQRNEWAAKYLAKIPLQEIAGEHADASTVGRAAREIVRSAGWNTKSRLEKPAPSTTHQEFPKYKYHRTQPELIVQDREAELALGDGWENTPPALAK